MNVVMGFKKQPDGTWGEGTVYVPDHGMSFSGYAKMLNPNQVKVSGYVLIPLFGSSEVWTRVNRKLPSCEEQARMIAPAIGRRANRNGLPPLLSPHAEPRLHMRSSQPSSRSRATSFAPSNATSPRAKINCRGTSFRSAASP